MTDDSYRVETPERIELAYDVAGLGSRFLAQLIDSTIQLVLSAVLWLAALATLGFDTEPPLSDVGAIALVGALLFTFVILWGYHVLFEMVWHGQTPGKRWLGLRVIKEGGYPVGFVDSVIRNVVRLIDFMPFYYVIGALVMFVDKRSRRLGDLAAGTLVVKERRDLRIDSVATGLATAERPVTLRTPELARLSAADQSLLREYVRRRPELAAAPAEALARRVAASLAPRLGREVGPEGSDAFLLDLAAELGWGDAASRAAPPGADLAAPRSRARRLRERVRTPIGVVLIGLALVLVAVAWLAWPESEDGLPGTPTPRPTVARRAGPAG
jgi:uncharacterized RDD family membrane protein YckC